MELEDKLKNLRRERGTRNRSRKIQDVWEKIEENENLSVKDKLERLISLTQKERPARLARSPEGLAAPAREPVQVLENSYLLGARYGHIPISLGLEIPGNVLAFLGRENGFETLDLSSAVFIDLETTGLAGGTGTVPFLVGLGFYRDERFRVVQFFLGEMAAEGRMVEDLGKFFEEMGFESMVTYNGKTFDVPLLETRFALHRKPFPLSNLPHLDFLFSARNLWKHKYESCRLFTLAREIVQADRAEDIPSAEIPLRYFQYIRTGDFSLIEPILYHNQEDLLSLLGVVVAGAVLVDKNRTTFEDGAVDAMDLFGVARVFERAGDPLTSAALFERALEGDLSREASQAARRKLSVHFKRNRAWDKALPLWQERTRGEDDPFCYRELAMYYEHQEKNYEEALRTAEEGLVVSLERASLVFQKDFEKRLVRLKGKINKKKGGARK